MTKDRSYCKSCGYDLIGYGEPEFYISKNGTSMVKIPFWCNECGAEWDEIFNIKEYGYLKMKNKI